ncbi:MAG: sigma 54-interacting transcriptional regulator [Planctomycetaceae bacterium]|nr:sigma 54-interacting transcriptional regulator [Planctomycetaceae bacterium]
MKKLVKNGLLDTEVMLGTFLNSTEECIVIVNKTGCIEALSRAYANFLQVDRDEVIGKHVKEVIENTRMHLVLKTGVSEIAEKQMIRGESMVASRIPIFQNGKVVGVMGRVLFKNLSDFNDLYDKLNNIEEELSLYKKSFSDTHRPKYSLGDIITVNPEMQGLKKMVARVSKSNSGVLLLGESGTGKELIAHSIHNASKRAQRPFISLNCGAIPADLLESELFGYEAGAFTGANAKGKIGLFKAADRGSIFLDEVGELSLKLQVKLLRFLQEKEIKKIGSNTTEKVDVRIIAATNRNLVEMMGTGDFRSDLYYRLSIVQLNVPPLRDRLDDIKLLARHLIRKICKREGLGAIAISDAALRCMQRYDWPGNVRELENVLESATNFVGPDRVIGDDQLPSRLIRVAMTQPGAERHDSPSDLKTNVENFEKECILAALKHNGNNRSRTADSLGIGRTSLYEKLTKYGLD